MRVILADASLARYAGQFVWLHLDFDKEENQAFLTLHGTPYTPSFYILDPADEHATATQLGAMTLSEVAQFLDRGARSLIDKGKTPADMELARGDELLARDQPANAADAYAHALRLGEKNWPERERAVASLVLALSTSKQWQPCAEAAAAEAPHMTRHEMFGRTVLHGLNCAGRGLPAPWAAAAQKTLEPLAVEAIGLPTTVRDHRFQLYQTLMGQARDRGDSAAVARWGNQWLAELDATVPANDDERSALDIARVDAAAIMGNPQRVLPALIASEQAMPTNYNASLRLAQLEMDAGEYAKTIAACDRGLKHVTGPLGRSWLLQVKAEALRKKGNVAAARRTLEEALQAAQNIPGKQPRANNIARITEALKETQSTAK